MDSKRKRIRTAIDVCCVVLLVLIAWELASSDVFGVLPEKMFPPPAQVFLQMVHDAAKIGVGIASSLSIVFQGFVLGGAVRTGGGLALGFQCQD